MTATSPILGQRHPDALGRSFTDVWHDLSGDIGPLIDRAFAGEAVWHEDLPLTLHRKGFDETAYFTFSYTPVHDEKGAVAGMFCACTETTGRVLFARRQAFRVELEGRLRGLADPGALAAAATRMLGPWLRTARVFYIEVEGRRRSRHRDPELERAPRPGSHGPTVPPGRPRPGAGSGPAWQAGWRPSRTSRPTRAPRARPRGSSPRSAPPPPSRCPWCRAGARRPCWSSSTTRRGTGLRRRWTSPARWPGARATPRSAAGRRGRSGPARRGSAPWSTLRRRSSGPRTRRAASSRTRRPGGNSPARARRNGTPGAG